MKRTVMILCLATGLAWVLPHQKELVAQQEEEVAMPEEAGTMEEAVPEESIEGSVVSVNLDESSLVLEYQLESEPETTGSSVFYLAPEVFVVKNGEETSVDMLEAGDNVFVMYYEDMDQNKIVQSLEILE